MTTETCSICKSDYDIPILAKPVVKSLGLESICPPCIGKGVNWAVQQSRKK